MSFEIRIVLSGRAPDLASAASLVAGLTGGLPPGLGVERAEMHPERGGVVVAPAEAAEPAPVKRVRKGAAAAPPPEVDPRQQERVLPEVEQPPQELAVPAAAVAASPEGLATVSEADNPETGAAPVPTIDEVRTVLNGKVKEGFRAEIKALMDAHGSDNITKVAEDRRASLMAAVSALRKP